MHTQNWEITMYFSHHLDHPIIFSIRKNPSNQTFKQQINPLLALIGSILSTIKIHCVDSNFFFVRSIYSVHMSLISNPPWPSIFLTWDVIGIWITTGADSVISVDFLGCGCGECTARRIARNAGETAMALKIFSHTPFESDPAELFPIFSIK